MSGQLGQVTLDAAEGEALARLGVAEQVGGQQLGTLDHTHGTDRRPVAAPKWSNTPLCLRPISSVETTRVQKPGVVTV